jgi:tetratricopeptide (TPR) repeat protein
LTIYVSLGCINEYETSISGELVPSDFLHLGIIEPKTIFDQEFLKNRAQELYQKYQTYHKVEDYSDYGVQLIYLEKYQEAKKVYFEIEEQTPDLYTTASNLGTLYELTGKPDSALYWIKKSMKINPQSHEGSEWIHVKILEYKLSGSKNTEQSIMGLNFGNKALPQNIEGLSQKELETWTKHLVYQLRERITFIKPKDKIVANLLFDLSNLLALNSTLEEALVRLEQAKEYGYEGDLLNIREQTYRKMTAKTKKANEERQLPNEPNPIITYGVISVIIFIVLLMVIVPPFFIFRKRKNQDI